MATQAEAILAQHWKQFGKLPIAKTTLADRKFKPNLAAELPTNESRSMGKLRALEKHFRV